MIKKDEVTREYVLWCGDTGGGDWRRGGTRCLGQFVRGLL